MDDCCGVLWRVREWDLMECLPLLVLVPVFVPVSVSVSVSVTVGGVNTDVVVGRGRRRDFLAFGVVAAVAVVVGVDVTGSVAVLFGALVQKRSRGLWGRPKHMILQGKDKDMCGEGYRYRIQDLGRGTSKNGGGEEDKDTGGGKVHSRHCYMY